MSGRKRSSKKRVLPLIELSPITFQQLQSVFRLLSLTLHKNMAKSHKRPGTPHRGAVILKSRRSSRNNPKIYKGKTFTDYAEMVESDDEQLITNNPSEEDAACSETVVQVVAEKTPVVDVSVDSSVVSVLVSPGSVQQVDDEQLLTNYPSEGDAVYSETVVQVVAEEPPEVDVVSSDMQVVAEEPPAVDVVYLDTQVAAEEPPAVDVVSSDNMQVVAEEPPAVDVVSSDTENSEINEQDVMENQPAHVRGTFGKYR